MQGAARRTRCVADYILGLTTALAVKVRMWHSGDDEEGAKPVGFVLPTARSPSGGMALARSTPFPPRASALRAYDDGQSTAYDRAGRRRWRRRRLRRGTSGGQRRRVAPTGWCRTRLLATHR